MSDTRHVVYLLGIHARSRTGFGGVESGSPGDHDLLKLFGVFLYGARDISGFTKVESYAIKDFRLMPNVCDFHFVRAAYTHTLNSVTAIDVSHGTIKCS